MRNAVVEPTTKKNGREPGGGLNSEKPAVLETCPHKAPHKASAQGAAQGIRTRLAKPCGAQGRPSAHKDFV